MQDEELRLLLLRHAESITSQKSLAQELGYSVGKINYVLKALIAKGLVKAEKFSSNQNKKQYKYLLTEEGLKEKIDLTEKFIEKKEKEYDMLQADLQMYKVSGDYALVKGSR